MVVVILIPMELLLLLLYMVIEFLIFLITNFFLYLSSFFLCFIAYSTRAQPEIPGSNATNLGPLTIYKGFTPTVSNAVYEQMNGATSIQFFAALNAIPGIGQGFMAFEVKDRKSVV